MNSIANNHYYWIYVRNQSIDLTIFILWILQITLINFVIHLWTRSFHAIVLPCLRWTLRFLWNVGFLLSIFAACGGLEWFYGFAFGAYCAGCILSLCFWDIGVILNFWLGLLSFLLCGRLLFLLFFKELTAVYLKDQLNCMRVTFEFDRYVSRAYVTKPKLCKWLYLNNGFVVS